MAREQFQTLTEPMYYILLTLTEECCGVDIMEKVKQISHGRVVVGPGTLYAMLAKFEENGVIKMTTSEGRRKSYTITEVGREMLQKEYDRLIMMAEDGQSFISKTECKDIPIYLDNTEKDNSKWLSFIEKALKTAKRFEIHCWNEETDWIEFALQYGTLKNSDWKYGKIVEGEVTPEFVKMILDMPKPADIEIYNKMTPFFNIFLDDATFQSSHYGTEIYICN